MTDPVTLTGIEGAPYLAVDVQPDNLVGTFVLDVSELDGPDVLAWTDLDADQWLNIVCDVQEATYRRGASRAQGLLTQTEAGTVTVTISDTERALDPMANRDVVHKGTPLRLRAWGTDLEGEPWEAVLFTGEIDQLGVTYHPEDPPTVVISGVDLIGPLAAWRSHGRGAPVGAGEDLLERAQAVLAECDRGTLSPDSDDVYVATLAASVLAQPWSDLIAAAEAELGRMWIDRDNRLVLRARHSELSGPVRGTLSDIHGDAPMGVHCCIADAAVLYGVELLGNRALATREGGGSIRRDDEFSQARYGMGVVQPTGDLILSTDAQLGPWAEAVVVSHTNPELRVDRVQPQPSESDLESALEAWPAVCSTDIGDRWLFQYHPAVGPVVDRAVGVLGIEMTATPEAWSVTWTTTDALIPGGTSTLGWFVLDESSLDEGDMLAPFAVT